MADVEAFDDFTDEELSAPDVNPIELLREQAREAWRTRIATQPILNEPVAERETAYVAGYLEGWSKGHSLGFIGGSAFTRVYTLMGIKQLHAYWAEVEGLSWIGLPEPLLALLKHLPNFLAMAEKRATQVERSEQHVRETDHA